MYDLLVLKDAHVSAAVTLQETDKTFVLGVPAQVVENAEQRGIDHSFFTDLHAPSFYGTNSLADLAQQSGIKGLAGRLEASSFLVAEDFMTKIEKGLAAQLADPNAKVNIPTNGLKYGVSTIDEASSGVSLGLHNSDYFTFTVANTVFRMLRQEEHPAVSDKKLIAAFSDEDNHLGFFFNSLGLNASIVVGQEYVVGVRPNGDLHVAMNEGLAKKPGVTPDLDRWFARGMENELGISNPPSFELREVFIVPSVGQLGLHVLAQVDADLATIREGHAKARDAWENQRLLNVRFNADQMQAIADNVDRPTVSYTRGLWAGLADDLRHNR